MRQAGTPEARGQHLNVEDGEGERWDVECLGEPVETGARIVFEPVGDPESRHGQMIRLQDGLRREWVCRLHRDPGSRGNRPRLVPFAGLSMPEVHLDAKDTGDARDGDRVVVVTKTSVNQKSRSDRARKARRGSAKRQAIEVRVREVLGPPSTPDSDHRAVVWKHRIAREFPRRARIEADALSDEIAADEIARRLDLRHLPFITIDPASARDHDDAVFAEQRPPEALALVDASGEARSKRPAQAWQRRLWVAIADVAHFVEHGSAMDAEARRRGNSFYFPDRAIPMLPERLSTQVCSLRPDVDRLAMVVELRIVEDGRVADAIFHEALIRSHARLAYEDAAAWLEDSDSPATPWGESLRCLDRIAAALFAARRAEGAIALEIPEIKIELDESGCPVDAIPRERNRAHLLIEEAMLAANRAVAAALDRAGRATLHRVHPPPSPNKLTALQLLLERLAISPDGPLEEPGVIAAMLEAVRGTASEERIHMETLRSMSQARYEAEPAGHYALRFDHYLHFTSPIRRYADLDVHRALKGLLSGRPLEARRDEECQRLAIWLSARERIAVEVERDAEALACCAIMKGREGEIFRAQVSTASEFGLFIRLESPAVGGLVPIRTLVGQWEFDPDDERLIGPHSAGRIGRGDHIEVRLLEVDADLGRLSFGLERERPASKRRGSARRRR